MKHLKKFENFSEYTIENLEDLILSLTDEYHIPPIEFEKLAQETRQGIAGNSDYKYYHFFKNIYGIYVLDMKCDDRDAEDVANALKKISDRFNKMGYPTEFEQYGENAKSYFKMIIYPSLEEERKLKSEEERKSRISNYLKESSIGDSDVENIENLLLSDIENGKLEVQGNKIEEIYFDFFRKVPVSFAPTDGLPYKVAYGVYANADILRYYDETSMKQSRTYYSILPAANFKMNITINYYSQMTPMGILIELNKNFEKVYSPLIKTNLRRIIRFYPKCMIYYKVIGIVERNEDKDTTDSVVDIVILPDLKLD